ncbi:MAG TPA: CoA transferase [Terriglobales bacterium]|nr:CoA transferase [Terriglobales bacterium]
MNAIVAASRLAGMGASITKVEPPTGDPLRTFAPQWYKSLAESQRVMTLDLKSADERQQLEALLAETDLLLTSSRPSALRRLQLDWETLHARHPQLCFVGIIGYPEPLQERSGHDLTYLASAGLATPPQLPATLFVDLAGAERCVTLALALLLHRERTGEAGCATVSLYQCADELAAPVRAGLTSLEGMLRGSHPLYGLYEASDGWIAVAALEPHFAERLLARLGLQKADREKLVRAFRQRHAQEWERWAIEHDLPLAAVRKL